MHEEEARDAPEGVIRQVELAHLDALRDQMLKAAQELERAIERFALLGYSRMAPQTQQLVEQAYEELVHAYGDIGRAGVKLYVLYRALAGA
jgi:hypothetical protein